jgi:uncharacterized protein YggU (UPF0235/DUF167 family)
MLIKAKIKANQPSFSVKEGAVWQICLKSKPEKNKANQELVNELSKLYGRVRIVSGFNSRDKVLELSR